MLETLVAVLDDFLHRNQAEERVDSAREDVTAGSGIDILDLSPGSSAAASRDT